jgi:hypothetical protein
MTSTVENNKLIAEFMGKEYENNAVVVSTNYITGQNPSGKVWQEPKYHNDYNWLMGVVDKIESLGIDVHINTCVCRIVDVGEDRFEDIECFVNDNKKQAVYNACIEFIKWWNENK